MNFMKPIVKNTFIFKVAVLLTVFLLPVFSAQASATLLMVGISDTVLFSFFIGAIIFLSIIIYVLGKAIMKISMNKSLWLKKWNKTSVILLFVLANLFSLSTLAQDVAGVDKPLIQLNDNTVYFLTFIVFVMFVIVLILFNALNKLLNGLKDEVSIEKKVEEVHKPSVLEVISQKLTDVVPLEKEEDLLFDHEYDGIRELDNNLPPWWKWMFYISIVFAVVYLFHFHIFKTGELSIAEYNTEMRVAEANVAAYLKTKADNVDETSVFVVSDANRLASGHKIWTKNCISCHNEDGSGNIGPNITDKYWIHGGDIKSIFKTIKYGVTEKGMQSWKAQLSPVQMQDVSSYILTLQGTNPENPKEPQGELYIPIEEAEADTSAVDI